MKAIILISSIFYILGLKISNKIDLIKKVSPIGKITIQKEEPQAVKNAIEFNEVEPAKTETTDTAATDEENEAIE